MSLRINDIAPDFTINTTQGEISLHNWIGDGWYERAVGGKKFKKRMFGKPK